MVYKDISLLSFNRTINLENEEEDDQPSEIIVVDVVDNKQCDTEMVSYFQSKIFKGEIKYPNIQYLSDALKQYRQGNYENNDYN